MTYVIRTGKGKVHEYDDEGIKKQNIGYSLHRKNLLIQIVESNPGILHTHVIKFALEYGGIPKRITEQLLEKLEKEKSLESIKLGNSVNSKRVWHRKDYYFFSRKKAIRNLEKFLETYEMNLRKLRRVLKKTGFEADQSNLIFHVAKNIWYYDWKIYHVEKLWSDLDLTYLIERHVKLKRELFDIACNANPPGMRVAGIVHDDLFSESYNAGLTFEEDYEDFML